MVVTRVLSSAAGRAPGRSAPALSRGTASVTVTSRARGFGQLGCSPPRRLGRRPTLGRVIVGVGIDVVDIERFARILAPPAGSGRAVVHPGRARPAGRVAGRPVRRQGGRRQGAGCARRPGVARLRGGLRGVRTPVAGAARHRRGRGADRRDHGLAPVAVARRRASPPPSSSPRARAERARRIHRADRPGRRGRADGHAAGGHPDGAGGRRARATCAAPARAASTARGWCCWSAPATTAGTRCTPVPGWPGAARGSTRCWSADRAHAGGGCAALRARRRPPARGRRLGRTPRAGSAPSAAADLVVDGILGIGGPRRAARAGGRARRRAARQAAPGGWPSTCPAGSTPTPARWPARPSAPT